jgi:hypothetical protein
MYSQVIILGGDCFCTVFSVKDQEVTIHDKETSAQPHIRAWLDQHGYPKKGEMLKERAAGVLPQGYYIKPYANDRYFNVHPLDNSLTERPAGDFGDVIYAHDGF